MASYPAQRDTESTQAYQAACAYFALGVDRSQEAVSQQLGKSRQIMSRWGARHDWVSRARDYDAALAELAAAQHQAKYLADLEAHRGRSMNAALGLYTVAKKLLLKMDNQITTLEVTPATLGVLLKAFQISLDLEAHALGLSTLLADRDNEGS